MDLNEFKSLYNFVRKSRLYCEIFLYHSDSINYVEWMESIYGWLIIDLWLCVQVSYYLDILNISNTNRTNLVKIYSRGV